MELPLFLVTVLACTLYVVEPHGRLLEPPSRSSMWRSGFNTPKNYNDNELFCGGAGTQHNSRRNGGNDGKCGICGDNYADKKPRGNEAGGKWIGKYGIYPTRVYKMGETIPVLVEITANHRGWFQFKLCPNNNHRGDPTPDCFDEYLLPRTDGISTYEVVQPLSHSNFKYTAKYQLPRGLTCSQCILQWRYYTNNNPDSCPPDQVDRRGCFIEQEEFRGCSDIAITNGDGEDANVCKYFHCERGETCHLDGTEPKCNWNDGGNTNGGNTNGGNSNGRNTNGGNTNGGNTNGGNTNGGNTNGGNTNGGNGGNTNGGNTNGGDTFECPARWGLFSNPKNCGSFYSCDHNKEHLMRCGWGTYFNQISPRWGYCDHKRNVYCPPGARN